MNPEPDDIVRLVLDFYASPGRYTELSDPAKPLPAHTGMLLELAATGKKAVQVSGSAIPARRPDQDLVAATVYFIEHVLMVPGGSNFRVLGLNPGASEDQIRKHYQLLNHLLLFDQHDKSSLWKTEFALRLNHAYGVLRSGSHQRHSHISLKPMTVPDNSGRGNPGAVGTGEAARAGRPAHSSAASTSGAAPIMRDHQQTQHDEANIHGHAKSAAGLDSSEQNMQRQGSGRKHKPSENSFVAANIERAYGTQGPSAATIASSSPASVRVDGAKSSRLMEENLQDDVQQRQTVKYVERSAVSAYPGAHKRRSFPVVQVTVTLLVLIGMGLVIYALQIEPTGLATRSVNEEINRITPVDEIEQARLAENAGNQPDMLAGQEPPEVSRVVSEQPNSAATLAPVQELKPEKISANTPKPNKQAQARVKSDAANSVARTSSEAAQAVAAAQATAPVVVNRTPATSAVEATQQPGVQSPSQQADLVASERVAVIAPKVDEPEQQIMIHKEAPADAPVIPKPVPVLTEVELNGLLARFIMAYNLGDIEMFAGLFAEHARSDDKNSRAGIRQDYLDLFSRSDKRQFSFRDIRWRVDGMQAIAEGGFSAEVRQSDSTNSTLSTGRISLYVEKNAQSLQITELKYRLDQAGVNSSGAEVVALTQTELQDLMDRFVSAYESGDLSRFTGLFAETARSDDQNSRAGIRNDYEALFSQTTRRVFAFNNMQWRIEGMRAMGEGSFNVSVQSRNAATPRSLSGSISLRAEKGPAGLLITEIKHRTK